MTHTQTTCRNRITLGVGKTGAHPAEVGALTSVFQKSATELKIKQKLQKCKHTIQIATFNIRTINRIGQLPKLTASAIGHNIDIICIQEHKYTYSEDIKYHDSGNRWTLATTSAWKNSVNAMWRCPWCNGYRRRKWTRQYEVKTWTRLTAFHIALIPLAKV